MAHHRLPGEGIAALAVGHHEPFRASNGQGPAVLHGQGRLFAATLGEVLGDHVGHAIAEPDVLEQIIQGVEAEFIEDVGDALARKARKIGIDVREAPVEQAPPEGAGLGHLLMLKRMANGRAGFTRHDEGEPIRVGSSLFRSDDFHRLAAL